MKKFLAMLLTLLLVATFGLTAMAETATDETVEATESTTDDTALADAWQAYCDARQSERLGEIKQELDEMVQAGLLTQEQADLIYADRTQRMEARSEQRSAYCGLFGGCGMGKGFGGQGRMKNRGRR